MNYHRRHNRRDNGRRGVWLFSTVALFLLVFLFYIGSGLISGSVHSVVAPIWRFSLDASDTLSSYQSLIKDKSKVVEENRALKEELEHTQVFSSELDILKDENEELREALGMKPREDAELTRVLARPPRTPYDVLIVDGGRNRGFSVGDRVIYSGTILLGEIEEVYGKSSRVSLYSSSGVESDVFIDDEEGTVTARGRGGGKFSLELSRDSEVLQGAYLLKVEDRIFMIGEIVDVTLPETGAVKIATAKVPVDIFSLRNVFIISSNGI